MTTNGFLFPQKAQALRDAGLRRISFSLDSLDRDNFKKITGRDGSGGGPGEHQPGAGTRPAPGQGQRRHHPRHQRPRNRGPGRLRARAQPEPALHRIHAAGFRARLAQGNGRARPRSSGPPASPLRPAAGCCRQSLRNRQTLGASPDGRGEIGIIAPVSEPFCGHCNRIRLTADGKIRTCLFSVTEHDLRSLLRGGASDEEIAEWLKGVVWQKEARHHIGEPEFVPPPRSMSCHWRIAANWHRALDLICGQPRGLTQSHPPTINIATMPTYEYVCEKCGHQFEKFQPISPPSR